MYADILPFDRSRLVNRAQFGARGAPGVGLQRTQGAVRLRYELRDGESRPLRAFQVGAARVRMPNRVAGCPPEAILINTAGGLTGGDIMSVEVDVGAGAALTVTSQACEKIYKTVEGETRLDTRLALEPGARLEWLPQPAILFDRSRFRRLTHIQLCDDSTFLGVDGLVFGRTAMNETVSQGFVSDGWRIHRGRSLIYADTFRIDGSVDSELRKPSSLHGGRACASLIHVAPDAETKLDKVRRAIAETDSIAGASAWNRMLVARIVAEDGYGLIRDLMHVTSAIIGRPMPKVWTI
jgi:urease accessory protein